MKFSFYFTLFLTFFSLINPSNIKALDKITNFHSDITINQDTSISIKETIQYTTDQQKHGIFRTIPFKYNKYTASIKKVSVNAPFSTSTNNGNLVLKIGDPQKTFSGNKTYEINYTIHNTIVSKDKPELYLDITGEYWQIPIEKSSATLHSPYAKIISSNCYSGPINNNDNLCEFDLNNFSYNETINQKSNFTIYASLNPNNQLIFPINYNYLKTPLALILSLFIILIWYFNGRDKIFTSPNVFNNNSSQPQKLKPVFYYQRIPFVYEPLDISPGLAGTIIDKQTNNRDVIAEIIDLARKKYLKITLIPKKGIFSKDDFLFKKLKSSDNKLPEQQKYLLDNIFKNKESIKLSSLKNTFYKYFNQSKNIINKSLVEKKYFLNNPQTTKIFLIIFLIIINILIFNLNTNVFIFNIFISFFILKNFSQRTALGHNLMLQAKGLKKTIKLGKWREEIKEKNLFIEEILPFAISLGVIKKLAKDMDTLSITPPKYFDDFLLGNHSLYSTLNTFSSS